MISGVAAALGAATAFAGPLADAAKKAEEQAAAGDVLGAHETLREAVSTFSAQLPFTIARRSS